MNIERISQHYSARLDESAVGLSVNSIRRHVIVLIIALMIVSFLVWAGISEIDQHVRATGRVVPAGKARTVQHLEGGIVMRILVAEGDEVKAGDPLFEIANTRVRTTFQEGEVQKSSLMIKRERLLAEVSGSNELRFSELLQSTQPGFVAAERELFSLRQQEFYERLQGLQTRMEQKRLEIEALKSRVSNMTAELDVMKRQVQIKQELFDSGIVSETAYLQVKSELLRLQADRNNAVMQIPVVRAEMDEAISGITEARNQYASNAKTDLNEVDVALSGLEKRLTALSDEVERSEIVSPIDGRINQLFLNTVGGVSQPGAPLAEITPAREALVVEGNMSTEDRGKVWPGLKAITHISAYDHALFGGLEGQLAYISPDTYKSSDALEFYKIRVALNSDRFDDERIVRPGMTADINILTGRISVLGALLKPLTRLRGAALREG